MNKYHPFSYIFYTFARIVDAWKPFRMEIAGHGHILKFLNYCYSLHIYVHIVCKQKSKNNIWTDEKGQLIKSL